MAARESAITKIDDMQPEYVSLQHVSLPLVDTIMDLGNDVYL